MALNDNIQLLGKRVSYCSELSESFTGLVVGVVVPMKGYDRMAGNDVLLLQDGQNEPDFVSGELDFKVLEN